MLRVLIVIAFLLAFLPAKAGPEEALRSVLLPGVKLGMSVTDFKSARPDAVEGPMTSLPASAGTGENVSYGTFMEALDIGSIGFSSYWYLTEGEKIIGCLRTRSMVGIADDEINRKASDSFSAMAEAFGEPKSDLAMRKGDNGFVKVKVDKWEVPSLDGTAYFVATNREITTGFIKCSGFPVGQVFIKPDDERFPLEDAATRSVVDITRPTLGSLAKKSSRRNGVDSGTGSPLGSSDLSQNERSIGGQSDAGSIFFFSGFAALLGFLVLALIGYKILRKRPNGGKI